MPIGVPISTARNVRIRLPMIGFSSPPAEPGGGVISVNTASESPPKPFQRRTPRTQTSQPSPKSVAASDNAVAVPLRRRRAAYSLFMALADPTFDAQQHVARCREH